jgi:queuine tRNA-ribosyltransferase
LKTGFPARLDLPHGTLSLPAFLPDATFGVVRSADAADLEGCKVTAVVMNTFHLMQTPGSSTIQSLGGLHRMSGWQRPIVTDSGGFQAYSLIHQNPKNGSLTDRGILFRAEGTDRKIQLTPEKTIQLQISYGADVVICLDDCTHAEAADEAQRDSVRRTVAWAARGKAEFERLVAEKRLDPRPHLFAVIQGGKSRELRRECAEALLQIGFDGFGYGGWPLDSQGRLLTDILAYTRELVPARFPLHALGVGHPQNVVDCARMGYGLFDSAMPTRDARHGRLYALRGPGLIENWFGYIYAGDDKHIKTAQPVDAGCDCACCARYSLGYLHHLFKLNDSLYLRLATLHNLRFMTRLVDRLAAGQADPAPDAR